MFINFCFQMSLKTAVDCCQTERQIRVDACMALRILHVSLIACQRTVRKWFRRTVATQLSNFESSEYIVYLERRVERFWKVHLKVKKRQNSFWIKSRTGEWDTFPQVRLTKLSRVSDRGWESTWRLVENILNIYYQNGQVAMTTGIVISSIPCIMQ